MRRALRLVYPTFARRHPRWSQHLYLLDSAVVPLLTSADYRGSSLPAPLLAELWARQLARCDEELTRLAEAATPVAREFLALYDAAWSRLQGRGGRG